MHHRIRILGQRDTPVIERFAAFHLLRLRGHHLSLKRMLRTVKPPLIGLIKSHVIMERLHIPAGGVSLLQRLIVTGEHQIVDAGKPKTKGRVGTINAVLMHIRRREGLGHVLRLVRLIRGNVLALLLVVVELHRPHIRLRRRTAPRGGASGGRGASRGAGVCGRGSLPRSRRGAIRQRANITGAGTQHRNSACTGS